MAWLDDIAEMVSPTRCAGCELPGTLLCPACARALPRIDARAACGMCGAPRGRGRCPECHGSGFAFASARCFGRLEPPLSGMVVLHKDGGERRLGPLLGALLAEALPGRSEARWDAVAFVPATAGALRRRGFDHAEAIATQVALALGLPLRRALSRRGAHDQRRLGRLDRGRAMIEAFAVVEPLHGRVLLVDDVFTTGATLDAGAAALLECGATEVTAAAVARACGRGAC